MGNSSIFIFLKSPWFTSTEQALDWLKNTGQTYVKTDEELKSLIPVLEPIQTPTADAAVNSNQTPAKIQSRLSENKVSILNRSFRPSSKKKFNP
jgi:hypothetical protein